MDHYNIYPKQFRSAKIPIEKNRCFVLMPFDGKFDIIYGNLKQALNENDFICNRADEIIGSKPIMNKILNEILKAHYIIADLTASNANVFYELGIAHTFKESQNIILLIQKGEKIPFDITHLNHILYNANNLKYLTSNVVQTLKDNKYVYDFYEVLQQKSIINIIHDNKEEFVNYLQISLDEYVPILTAALAGHKSELTVETIESLFNALLITINKSLSLNNNNFTEGLLKVLFETIISCSDHHVAEKIVYDFLYGNFFDTFKLNDSDIISYQTELAILLSSNRVQINSAMSWLINYFKRSKSTVIDLNRYKIERFFMISSDDKINTILIDSIFHENCYIREHIADICGEKELTDACDSLCTQLLVEKNYFSAISMIAALGKVSENRGVDAIIRWIEINEKDIIQTEQFFTFKHARIAIEKIDRKYNFNNVPSFDKKYGKYLKDYFIL